MIIQLPSFTGKLMKSGNSYAIRVPIAYVRLHKLKLAQKVVLASEPGVRPPVTYDDEAFWKAVSDVQSLKQGSQQ